MTNKNNQNLEKKLSILFVEDDFHPEAYNALKHLPEWQEKYIEKCNKMYEYYNKRLEFPEPPKEELLQLANKYSDSLEFERAVESEEDLTREEKHYNNFLYCCLLDGKDTGKEMVEEKTGPFKEIYKTYLNEHYSAMATKASGIETKVDTALEAGEAIEKMEQKSYDFVVTDLGLPKEENPEVKSQMENIITQEKIEEFYNDSTNGLKEITREWYFEENQYGKEEIKESYLRGRGVLVAKVAKEKGIPAYISTSNMHFQDVLNVARIGDQISLEQFKEATSTKPSFKDKYCQRFGDDLYITVKHSEKGFADVFEDATKHYFSRKELK